MPDVCVLYRHHYSMQIFEEALPVADRAHLLMRLVHFDEALAPLEKLLDLDHANRPNRRPLLDLTRERTGELEGATG